MRYVVVDLEATSWDKGTRPDRMEIIEIGAVLLGSSSGPALDGFGSFVRPVESPELSEFCTQLTSIRQADVDTAGDFATVFPRFVEWIGAEPFRLCSWGAYDLNQFRTDCTRHRIALPATFEPHINLKQEFARLKGFRPMGMKGALAYMGIPLEGMHHRGADDARNIAKLAQVILPQLEVEESSDGRGPR